jgi:hypothetical protein
MLILPIFMLTYEVYLLIHIVILTCDDYLSTLAIVVLTCDGILCNINTIKITQRSECVYHAIDLSPTDSSFMKHLI